MTINFQSFPKELQHLILYHLPLDESLALLKVNHSLKSVILKLTPFLHKVAEIQMDLSPDRLGLTLFSRKLEIILYFDQRHLVRSRTNNPIEKREFRVAHGNSLRELLNRISICRSVAYFSHGIRDENREKLEQFFSSWDPFLPRIQYLSSISLSLSPVFVERFLDHFHPIILDSYRLNLRDNDWPERQVDKTVLLTIAQRPMFREAKILFYEHDVMSANLDFLKRIPREEMGHELVISTNRGLNDWQDFEGPFLDLLSNGVPSGHEMTSLASSWYLGNMIDDHGAFYKRLLETLIPSLDLKKLDPDSKRARTMISYFHAIENRDFRRSFSSLLASNDVEQKKARQWFYRLRRDDKEVILMFYLPMPGAVSYRGRSFELLLKPYPIGYFEQIGMDPFRAQCSI